MADLGCETKSGVMRPFFRSNSTYSCRAAEGGRGREGGGRLSHHRPPTADTTLAQAPAGTTRREKKKKKRRKGKKHPHSPTARRRARTGRPRPCRRGSR